MFILLQLTTLKQVQVHVLSLKWGLKIAKEFLGGYWKPGSGRIRSTPQPFP